MSSAEAWMEARRGSNYNEQPAPLVRSRGFMGGDVEHLIFYERGVGTTALDQMRGGIFGAGLAANIRRAHRILSFYYEPGDEVFVFGFSRGAYTARSLVGFIGAVAYSKATTVRKNWNARRGNFTEPRQMTVFRVFGQALRRMFTNGRISVSTA